MFIWANYIKQYDNYEIIGNKLLGEKCSEEEYTSEINFLIDFIKNQLPRDTKYYLNKTYKDENGYLIILEAYKEFLILNEGFVNCSKTNQIVLPENLKKLNPQQLTLINEKIQKAISDKNIEEIYELYNYLF